MYLLCLLALRMGVGGATCQCCGGLAVTFRGSHCRKPHVVSLCLPLTLTRIRDSSGVFVFLDAATAGPISPGTARRRAVRLMLVGVARLGVTTAIGYGVDPSEYGVHLNFFLILALLVPYAAALARVGPAARLAVGAGLAVAYQCVLLAGLQDIVFADREDPSSQSWLAAGQLGALAWANKEGLVQVVGLAALHALASGTRAVARDVRVQWAAVAVLHIVTECLSRTVAPPSRRLANITYVAWCMLVGTAAQAATATAVLAIGRGQTPRPLGSASSQASSAAVQLGCPQTAHATSGAQRWCCVAACLRGRGLAYLLAANISVGLTNVLTDVGGVNAPQGAATLVVVALVLVVGCGVSRRACL